MTENKYKVCSLFSGAGGFDLGFKQAGFDIIFANDNDKNACETYTKNIGDHIVQKDITQLKLEELPLNVDVLIGGFPCQGFSVANKKRSENQYKDTRNFLYKEMMRCIHYVKPKIIVAENVKGILSLANGYFFNQILEDLKNLGYKVDYRVINAKNYGVPQSRERVIIIANKLNVDNIFPDEEPNLISVQSVCEFLSEVDFSEHPIMVNNILVHNHIGHKNVSLSYLKRSNNPKQVQVCSYLRKWKNKKNITIKEINRLIGSKHKADHWFRDDSSGSIPRVEDWDKLKQILEFDSEFDNLVKDYHLEPKVFEQSLRVVKWNSPSRTITSTNAEIHINKKRRLSVRECALIQSFPNDFVFCGSLSSMYRQVGNAVPPKLAKAIGLAIYNSLENKKTFKPL